MSKFVQQKTPLLPPDELAKHLVYLDDFTSVLDPYSWSERRYDVYQGDICFGRGIPEHFLALDEQEPPPRDADGDGYVLSNLVESEHLSYWIQITKDKLISYQTSQIAKVNLPDQGTEINIKRMWRLLELARISGYIDCVKKRIDSNIPILEMYTLLKIPKNLQFLYHDFDIKKWNEQEQKMGFRPDMVSIHFNQEYSAREKLVAQQNISQFINGYSLPQP